MEARDQWIRLGLLPGEDRLRYMQPAAAGAQRMEVRGPVWHLLTTRRNVAERSKVSLEVSMWILLVVASLVLATARPVAAQFPTDVAVGSRVRVMLPDSLRHVWGPRVQWVQGGV